MKTAPFWKAGHTPTLFAAFLYFDLSFMVWILLGPLAVQIAQDFNLTPSQKGMMVATPLLAGALLRIVMGVLADYLQPKKAGMIGQLLVMAALAWAWLSPPETYQSLLTLGLMLGVAGASFSAALPLASRWYPPEHQGRALGITGAGNSGTAIAALVAPSLALSYGWPNVFGWCLLPLALCFVLYMALAKDAPATTAPKPLSAYLRILKDKDAWWFVFFYGVSFGGFSGLASSLTLYFNHQYGLSAVTAGYFTAACVLAGSAIRPVGGLIADRIGGIKTLSLTYLLSTILLFLISLGLPSSLLAMGVIVLTMLMLGCGNGAVFQLVPQRFRREMGIITGLIGMAGGLGGFYLASSLGYSMDITGSYQWGFTVFAALAASALIGLSLVKSRWRNTWGSAFMTRAHI